MPPLEEGRLAASAGGRLALLTKEAGALAPSCGPGAFAGIASELDTVNQQESPRHHTGMERTGEEIHWTHPTPIREWMFLI